MNMIIDNIPPEMQTKKHHPAALFANNDIIIENTLSQTNTSKTKEMKHHEYMA